MDEVGELSDSIQSSFLRVLQEKTFRPVGSETEVYSDFRVICATHQNLDKMACENEFRTDLLYRLKTFVLKLPALKDREGDISLIAKHQVKKCCEAHRVPEKKISPDFLGVIEKYNWPGNVRELINTIEISVTAARFEDTLFAMHLPVEMRTLTTVAKIKNSSSKSQTATTQLSQLTNTESLTHKALMEKTEKEYLDALVLSTGGNVQQLIDMTGLSRTVLYRKLKKYEISL